MSDLFNPYARPRDSVMLSLALGWVAFIFLFWFAAPFLSKLFPSPAEAVTAAGAMWQRGAAYEMTTSLGLSLETIVWSTAIALTISYLSAMPFFHPVAVFIGGLRRLSLAGLIVAFIMITPNGHALKLAVLVFSMTVFFVNDMVQVVEDIPQQRFEHAMTLGMSRWQVFREVVIRGTLPQVFESLRANAAISWMMLTSVEGLSRSEGGIGVLLLNLDRTRSLAPILVIQALILVVGVFQDRLIKWVKGLACPYAKR